TAHAWQNQSPEIFLPVFSPLFGFHSRTTDLQNIFRLVPCLQSLILVSTLPVSNGEVLFLWVSSLVVSETFPAGRYFHISYLLYKISGNFFDL
ncbi:hypothetical protein, partial [Blautia sp. CAG:237]|uniref:hypothetical protein n=1 Tax=Blautia sp. CAG:237 TaxID=1262755 RepID=UPI0025C47F7B